MIDINRLKKELNNYINKFDVNDPQIAMKIKHTYRVSSLSKQLASHLRLSDEDVDLPNPDELEDIDFSKNN